jgi:NAD(P)-dependent dehydrogenase (short-subunit alcohol dehydrogenase family)
LGAGYALAVAEAGGNVVVNDIDPESADRVAKRITAGGARAVAHPANVADWGDARGLVERCVAEFGAIDGLVNNAGILRCATIEEQDEAAFRECLEVNILGTAFPGIHAARQMLAQHGGSIVNVSSMNQCGHQHVSAYGASKGGASSLTYAWAAELGGRGVRVNAISPRARSGQTRQLEEYYHGHNPENAEYPSEAHNAAVVVFLLSDAAAGVNGQIVRVQSEQLTLITHPAMAYPSVQITVGELTAEFVEHAFDESLRERQFPVGIAAYTIDRVDNGDAW